MLKAKTITQLAATYLIAVTAIHAAPPSSQPDTPLSRQIRTLLKSGRLDEAVAVVQEAYRRAPDDPRVRAEFVELHLSLADHLLRDQQFSAAERVARAVVKAEPGQADALRLLDGLTAARKDVPQRVAEARRLIRLEWFGPAYEALSQAAALLPDRRNEWTGDLLAAAEGAGDDHYFCKNFREAFFYYDVARRSGRPVGESLNRRWLHSQVFSLADDVDHAKYPIEYWHKIVTTAEPLARQRSDPLMAVLRGLANENLGDADRAVANYAEATGQAVSGRDAASIRSARRAAIRLVRGQYDESLSPRRAGVWRKYDPGDWGVVRTPHFVVHHRNAEVGRRVADAMEYHFDRIARYLGATPDRIAWQPCDVYLHKDLAAFRAATGRNGAERAISITKLAGVALRSHTVHVTQTDPMLMSARLPHELMHLMIGAITGHRKTCAILNEGLALSVEPRCRTIQFARVLADEGGPRPVQTLLAIAEPHPAEQRRFYGEARRLVALLLARGPASRIVAAAAEADPAAALRKRFQLADLSALDIAGK